ncbi:MAG: hypothetical protein D6806_01865 [Deltaproteobacteria bacterium]|nr:MAG: hypothetical protein D6806_01865 [Deltaproteobacteria bacterium]
MGKKAVFAMALCFAIVACASHTLLPPEAQRQVIDEYVGTKWHLRHSCFVGAFYAYPDRYYVSERGFDELPLVQTMSGEPILPEGPRAILPLGTPVTIAGIEFPTSSALSGRRLKSPRHFTWVMLEADAPQADKPLVLVLTQEMKTPAHFLSALKKYLQKKDPTPQYEGLSERIRKAIDRKMPVEGMPADALLRCRGYPDKLLRKNTKRGKEEIWIYSDERRVYLLDDVVVKAEGFEQYDLPVWRPAQRDGHDSGAAAKGG